MAFLVAGALRVAAQMADARESLGRKGKYCVLGPRVALTLSSPGVSATTVTALEGVFSALGFESCWRREASVPGFLEELAWFREQVDARRGPVGCAGVALVAPEGQLRQSQRLVQELSRCRALWGRPKLFLLLSSAPGALEPGALLTALGELCGRCPHWSLLQLLTETTAPRGRALIVTQVGTHPKGLAGALGCLEVKGVAFLGLAKHLCPTCSTTRTVPVLAAPCALRLAAHGLVCDRDPRLELRSCLPALLASDHKGTIVAVFGRVAEKPAGGTSCPVLRSSLRGELCLGQGTPWGLEPEPIFRAPYDLSGAKAALLLAVIRDRPGAQRDVEALECLCQALGFETTLRIDPAAQAFREELARFREQLDNHRGPVSCALVALMAHGGQRGQLLGADGQEVQPEALVQELSRCQSLRGHPKIFLLQACRGGHRDPGVGPASLPWLRSWTRAPAAIPSHADVLQIFTGAQGSSSRDPLPGDLDQADVLTVYSAAEGCVAYRDEKGSDFIQELVEVVRAHPQGDLLELLTEVNRRVCELDVLGPDSTERRKACLEIRSSLRRRLCLQV